MHLNLIPSQLWAPGQVPDAKTVLFGGPAETRASR